MQRYFIDYPQVTIGDRIIFSKDQAHHIDRVMRMKTGDQVIGVDQSRQAYLLTLTVEEDLSAKITEAIEKDNELPVQIDFVCGLPKGSKLEHIVQKGSELGVFNIYPWQADRSISKWEGKKSAKKIERLQKIATEASEQSHRNHEVQVKDLVSTKQLLALSDKYDHILVAYEESAKAGETSRLASIFTQLEEGARILMIFGPEGGISEKEIELFETLDNMSLVGLGNRILRTETAPLFALSALVYEMELR